MFDFLKKKNKEEEKDITIRTKVWMTTAAKHHAFINEWKNNSGVVFIFWFDQSLREAEKAFAKETTTVDFLLNAANVQVTQLALNKIVFAEHHPLFQKEISLIHKLNINHADVWAALDEPLFKQFGGEKIIAMMQKLGMAENESLENALIDNAIQSAQGKIAKKVLVEQSAISQIDWLRANLK